MALCAAALHTCITFVNQCITQLYHLFCCLQLTSPGAGVAILGLCVSSWAAHTAYYNTGEI